MESSGVSAMLGMISGARAEISQAISRQLNTFFPACLPLLRATYIRGPAGGDLVQMGGIDLEGEIRGIENRGRSKEACRRLPVGGRAKKIATRGAKGADPQDGCRILCRQRSLRPDPQAGG